MEQNYNNVSDELEDKDNQIRLLKDNLREQSENGDNLLKMTEALAAREATIQNLQKIAEEHSVMGEKIGHFEELEKSLNATLAARENQLQNLQGQLASGADAENRVQQLEETVAKLEVECDLLKEKNNITEEQMVDTVQAKDTQLSAMKESKNFFAFFMHFFAWILRFKMGI